MKKLLLILCQAALSVALLSAAELHKDATLSGTTVLSGALNTATGTTLLATPQQYGAIADGSSHPVSEWLTGGSHDRGYANLAAIQGDYPDVITLNDESDWAATMRALHHHKAIFMPPSTGSYVFGNATISHTLNSSEAGQIIYGAGMNDPHGSLTSTTIKAGRGVDGIRFTAPNTTIKDISIDGTTIPIHSIANDGGGHAVMTTSAAHGLRTTPELSGGWTITANTVSGQSMVTTSAPHCLTTGDWIKIAGSSGGVIDGIFRVVVTDAAGSPIIFTNPDPASRYFKLVKTDRSFQGAASNGGACSLVKMYELVVGPHFSDTFGTPITGASPEVLGFYHFIPTSSTALDVYKLDNTRLVMVSPADADKGTLFTTRRAVSYGDDENIFSSQESGHGFTATSLYISGAGVGLYGGSSDGGSGAHHIVTVECGIGIWADADLDTMHITAPWIDGCIVRGITVTGNGGMLLEGGGIVDSARPIYVGPDLLGNGAGGNRFFGNGIYFEGNQRDTFADGSESFFIEVISSSASIQNFVFVDSLSARHIKAYYSNVDVRKSGPVNTPFNCWEQGTCQIFGDQASHMRVNYNGLSALSYDFGSYIAGDYKAQTADNALPAATQLNLGAQYLQLPYGGSPESSNGLFQNINVAGTPTWRKVSGALAGLDTATESNLTLADVTTGNVSITKHGFAPKAPNDATKYLDGTGAWTIPTPDVAHGGTGQTAYTAGDLLYATGSTTLVKLAKGSDGQVLTIDAGTHLPVWAAAPGAQTTFTAVTPTHINNLGGTGTGWYTSTDLTIASVPVGTYSVIFEGGLASINGSGGFKWDLNGGTAVLDAKGECYQRMVEWSDSGAMRGVLPGATGSTTNGYLKDGEDWPDGGTYFAGISYGFRYGGVIVVTTAGSVAVRLSHHAAGNGGDFWQNSRITLIKQ